MTGDHNSKSCKQRLVCRLCFELQPTEMYDYMKTKTNEDHDNVQPRESGTDAIKCALVNGKLEAEVTSMCLVAVWVGPKSSKKMVKTIYTVG